MEHGKVFKITRAKRGKKELFVVSAKFYRFFLFPYWSKCPTLFTSFIDCLGYIRDWCFARNIGRVLILDSAGPNKRMKINYRRYPEEDLRKALKIGRCTRLSSDLT